MASGGGRHPTELYVCVRDVAGLEPGIYRYDGQAHHPEWVNAPPDAEKLISACGAQAWIAGTGLLVFFTSVFARNVWKYRVPRSFCIRRLDADHLAQTSSLVATALGLRMTFTAALLGDQVEQLLH